MTTRYIPVTTVGFHKEIRIDTDGADTHITVYSLNIKDIDLLIQQLEALKAEQVKPVIIPDEPPQMTAVLGQKPMALGPRNPAAWYGDALRKNVAAMKVSTDDFGNKHVGNIANRSEPTKYYTCAETATFVRQALKEAFPTQKFTVRSKVYSGGASITVGWMDGVTEYEVNQVVQRFSGADFDGMIDLKSNVYRSDENGANVSYGADYVFCNRHYSNELTLKLAKDVAFFVGIDLPAMDEWGWYSYIGGRDERSFTTSLSEARYCYSATDEKYIGDRFGYVPQWIQAMIG